MRKVMFVIPKNRNMLGKGTGISGFPHIGIAYLTAVLKKNDVQVKIYDDGIGKNENNLYALIDEFQPHLIGVTGLSYGSNYMEDIIKKLKKYNKDIYLVAGGPHIASAGIDIMRSTPVDFAMTGEGEIPLMELLRQTSKKTPDFSRVPNLFWKKKDKIIKNFFVSPIEDLDQIPFPDYEEFELKEYSCFQDKLLPIITSRGCPHECNYCSVRLSMGKKFRARSPENVFAEFLYWYKKGFCSFDINDDCFTLDLKRAEKICDLIIRSKIKIKFQLYNGIRADRVSLSLLKKMKKAGCGFISYGCESGSQEILDKIRKNITIEQVKRAVEWTNKVKIKNSVNFIIGHREESYSQAKETLAFAGSLPANFVNFYNLIPYPGTDSYKWAVDNARFLVSKKNFLKEVSYRDNTPIYETEEFTKEQREEIINKGINLYKRKILQFRFGNFLGLLIYAIIKVKIIESFCQWLVYGNKYGGRIYQVLTAKSKS